LVLPTHKGLSTQDIQRSRWETKVSNVGPIHPKNAAGPFYVLNGCCTACGVPTALAPELFDFDATDHCYVKRQPASDQEMENALRVLRAQELECVRYRGTDEAIAWFEDHFHPITIRPVEGSDRWLILHRENPDYPSSWTTGCDRLNASRTSVGTPRTPGNVRERGSLAPGRGRLPSCPSTSQRKFQCKPITEAA
jgi:hypothetical protein